MRITYLHQYFNTAEMAGSTRSFELARRLVAKGHEVNMITSWREEDDRKDWFETNEAGIRVHWLPVPYSNTMGYRERIQAFFRFAWGAARRAAAQPADIVYATSTPLTIALPGAYAASRQKVPMIFEVRDLWPDVPVAMGAITNKLVIAAARRLEKFAYARAATIVALTPTMRDFVSGKGAPLERISVISNGASLDRFEFDQRASNLATESSGETTDRQRILLYCGSLGPAHGPEYLVSLAEEFLRQAMNISILVVGDGKLRDTLEERARQSGSLDKTISFAGSVPQEQVPKLYASADASIMTMADCELLFRHSVQNKFFDSLAAGVPVFSNYAGWASELANQERAGLILPMDDVPAAARLVDSHIRNAVWLSEGRRAARRLIENRFNFDLLAENLESVLIAARGRH